MRRMLAIALALLLLGGVALADKVPGNRLGLGLLSHLTDGKQNAFVSPVGLAWGLSMAAEGSGGETRQHLLKALDVEAPEETAALASSLEEAGLRWANAAFARQDLKLLPEYEARLTSVYGAGRFPLAGGEEADAWAREKTDGLVDGLPAFSQLEDARLVLLNALAMEAEWASPFDPDQTWEDDFHAPEGDVRVPFMHQEVFAQYGEGLGMRYIQKAYMGGRFSMMLALPNTALKNALSQLKKNGMDCFQFRRNPVSVSLTMPKLDLCYDADLSKAISAWGCWVPFHPDYADYSGISDEKLVISEVSQRLRVQIDEGGTRAAAVTEVDMTKSAGHRLDDGDPVELVLDKPFLFIIFDRETGAVCFAGAVANPLG